MSEFYITKVLAKGSGKTDSIVELQPNLSLNKSVLIQVIRIIKCIYFYFGSKNKTFDNSLRYSTIELNLYTPKGDIQISPYFVKTMLM